MFCVYCGAEMKDTANFCTKCGNPVSSDQAAPVEEITSEESSVISEKVAAEDSVASEEIAVNNTETNEGIDEEKPAAVNLEKEVTEEAAEEAKQIISELPAKEKPVKKKSLAKKNLTSAIVFVVSAAVVAGIGFFAAPKLVFHSVFEKEAVSNSAEAAMTFYKANGDADAVSSVKFTIARKALADENYAYAAAVFADLNNQQANTFADMTNPNFVIKIEDLTSYIDEAFAGRCRVLLNGGKYNIAEADSTQISDALLSAGIVNDTLVSKAKLLSAEGKTVEAYEMIAGVNTDAAYDSESYNIIVYNYAVDFYNEMKFAEAYEILADATDEASVELRNSSAYYMANDYLKDKDYEKAIEMYEKAGDFSDAKERLKQCNYQLGLRYYNMDKLDTALEYFTAADGYNEAASYIKKIEEKKAYIGWKIDGFTTDYVNTLTGRPNPEKTRIASMDPFIYYFTVSNVNNNTNGITLNIKITTPDGHTADETFTNVKNGDVNCYISGYELPMYGALGRANFTVTLVETGEVLDICYCDIY